MNIKYITASLTLTFLPTANSCLGGAKTLGGSYCPGEVGNGGDYCPSEYTCVSCSDEGLLGGLCLSNEAQNYTTYNASSYFQVNTICQAMNNEGAGRNCGGSWCETQDYCVDCSAFGKSELSGYVCLNGELSVAMDGFYECQVKNGIFFKGC